MFDEDITSYEAKLLREHNQRFSRAYAAATRPARNAKKEREEKKVKEAKERADQHARREKLPRPLPKPETKLPTTSKAAKSEKQKKEFKSSEIVQPSEDGQLSRSFITNTY